MSRGLAGVPKRKGETGLSRPARSCSESIGGPDFTRTYAHSPPRHNDVGGACRSADTCVSAFLCTYIRRQAHLTTRGRRRGFARSRSRNRGARRRRRRRFTRKLILRETQRRFQQQRSQPCTTREKPGSAGRAYSSAGNYSRNRVVQESAFVQITLYRRSPIAAYYVRGMLPLSYTALLYARRTGCCYCCCCC